MAREVTYFCVGGVVGGYMASDAGVTYVSLMELLICGLCFRKLPCPWRVVVMDCCQKIVVLVWGCLCGGISVCIASCSYGSSMFVLFTGFISVIVSVRWPYSCLFCSIYDTNKTSEQNKHATSIRTVIHTEIPSQRHPHTRTTMLWQQSITTNRQGHGRGRKHKPQISNPVRLTYVTPTSDDIYPPNPPSHTTPHHTQKYVTSGAILQEARRRTTRQRLPTTPQQRTTLLLINLITT